MDPKDGLSGSKDRVSASKAKAAEEDNTYDSLEKDFQEVSAELSADKNLEKFRIEYEKLYLALKKSHESERRLMSRCRELNAELTAGTAKLTAVQKTSQDDKNTIASQKEEIDRLWKMLDEANAKQSQLESDIAELKLQIANLSKLVEQGAGLSVGQDSSMQELYKKKEQLTKERDAQLEEITTLRRQMAEAMERQQKAEQQREAEENKVRELHEEVTAKTQDLDRENRKKSKLEKEMKKLENDIVELDQEVKTKQSQITAIEDESKRLEQQLKETKANLEHTIDENNTLTQRLNQAQQDNENQLMHSEQLAKENSQKSAELKLKDEEIARLKLDIMQNDKLCEGIKRKLRAAEEEKAQLESAKETLKRQIGSMEREIETLHKQAELEKKAYDDLVRERDLLSKSLRKAEGSSEKLQHLTKIKDQSIQTLQQDVASYKEEAKKQRQIIQALEKERDHYGKDAAAAQQNCIVQMEEVKTKEMQLYQLKKKIAESESKLKQQQTLYEAVCSDRNLCSKNLIEARDEITEMKRKLKIMSHQIDQLKEEIASKESALVKSNMDLMHVEREKEQLASEVSQRKQELETTKKLMDNQQAEESKLRKIITEASAEITRQKKELEKVISERDILGTQLIRRNDELALLYEKIKIQQSTLNKGEVQYSARVEDIRILKLEIKKMRRERAILSKSVSNVDDLRRELFHIQRELLKERTRCKALEEELENPMNIHRWRKLEGSDPSTYEMIQKIHTLQRRLIQKTEEVVEKELLIQEKEKLYIELKEMLKRQPGPEVAEQLQIYQQTLKEKTKQMKSMASELNMYESQVSEHKMDIERLQKELQEVKKKYYMQKKKEMTQKEKDRTLTQSMAPPVVPQSKSDMPKFTGGGFNLKPPQKVAA